MTIDILIAMLQPNVEGNDASGYRAKLQIPNSTKLTFFVVKEEGHYKILDTIEKPNSVGLEILDRIAANNLEGARVLLDWIRDEQHLAGGDDPLAGQAFPRFWTKGQSADARQMTLAAAAILVQTKPTSTQGISILEAARNSALSDQEKLNISLALLAGYSNLDQWDKRHALSSQLSQQYPDSSDMYFTESYDLRRLGRFDEADKLAEARLKRLPDDPGAMRELVFSAANRGDFVVARERGLRIVDAGKAEAQDFNNRAWFALVAGKVTDADVEDAIKASQLSQNSAGILHTLGCLYAAMGKTREARDVLIQAMNLLNLDEPDSSYWYAFGLLADQYGERDVAMADYVRVEKPKGTFDVLSSSYQLAQARLKVLQSSPGQPKAISK